MTPERWQRLQEAIQAALEAPPADRERVLAGLLPDDPELLSEARSIVRVAENTGGFLQRPARSSADASGAESPGLLGRTLGHYRLEEPLGSGGMGDVFRARDLALGRDSAIKVLPRRVRPALRERLLREAEAAAKLQHPAIATFYEAGEDQGEAFIAMEFVRGETLRVRLRKGALPLEESLALASCILGALGHAHAAGVLHRDIKPENVMVTGSRSGKLLDFGLARSFGVATPNARTEEALTTDQAVPGTVGYMSPEQVLGEKLDARSDIFQAGIVLFECLTGEAAFGGASPSERVAALFARELDLARLAGRSLPAPLAPILSRALARDPARRYPSAGAFLRELAALQEGRVDTELPGILAVLDFASLSGDPAVSWLGAGLAETLVSDLSRAGELEVVPRSRVGGTLAALGPEVANRELAVGLALGCSWVLSGAYQTASGAVRITANLCEVSTERIVASAKVDGRLDDIFSLQDRIAQLVQSHLRLAAGKPTAARKTPQVRVYELITRASAFLAGLKREQLDQAVELLEDAIRLEPGYAPAHAALANAYAFRAIAITSSGDLDAARVAADRALALEPLNAAAHKWKGYALWRQELWQEALPVLRKAVELAPGDAQANTILGSCCLFSESKRGALPFLQRGVELEPRMGFGWFMLGTAHMALLSIPEARYAFERCLELEGSPQASSPTAGVAAYLAEALRIEGRLEEAWQRTLEGIQAAEASDHALRDSFRAYALCVLGRIALQRGEPSAARAAYGQVQAQLRGRTRTRGSGHLMIQALAGLGRAGDGAAFEEGLQLVDNPHSWNFEPFSGCTLERSLLELARAAQALERHELAQELLARARAAGSLEPFEA
jgi:serine/threonine-protein kinase